MDKINEYINKVKDLAEDAGEGARDLAGEVFERAKELTEEGGKARELAQSAKEQTSSITAGAKEMVQGVLQDARAVKEIKLGIAELEALPEVEGSIVYRMELETLINYLKSLVLSIEDKRLDDASVAEEISKVMDKVRPDEDPQAEEPLEQETVESQETTSRQETVEPQETAEQQAINKAKAIAYNACKRAMETLNKIE